MTGPGKKKVAPKRVPEGNYFYFAGMRKCCLVLVTVLATLCGRAQDPSYVQEGEFGISAGAAHYFGDLNTRARLNRPKLALGAFFRKQFTTI